MDPSSFVGLAGVPVVVALVQLVKVSDPTIPDHYWPVVSLVLGVVFNLLLALIMASPLGIALLVGIITGLSASGLYSYSRVGK